jgi:ferrous iron transport protein A
MIKNRSYFPLRRKLCSMQQSVHQLLPLEALSPGAAARLAEIRGGRTLQRKLGALGLRVGTELRVEHRRGRGLVVAAGASRIALGGGIVDKLLVLPLPGTGPPVDGLADRLADGGPAPADNSGHTGAAG